MHTETHAVYAVLDTIHGPHRVRVSEHMAGDKPWDHFYALEADPRETPRDCFGRFAPKKRPILHPGYEVYGRPVRFFAVRATADPAWPAAAPVLSVKSTV